MFVFIICILPQVAEACTEMEQYLRSQGVIYNGEEEKEIDGEKVDETNIEVADEVEEEVEDDDNDAMEN